MHYNVIDDKKIKKFLKNYLDIDDIMDTHLEFNLQHSYDGSTCAITRVDDISGRRDDLGKVEIDDFTCVFHLSSNKENKERIRYNGNYNKMHLSKDWRLFVTKQIEQILGDTGADDYVEDFLSSTLGTVAEYNKLMAIAYANSNDKAMKELYCKEE